MFVGLGAVVTIGRKNRDLSQGGLSELSESSDEGFLDIPLECVEIAGQSLLERMVERFAAMGIERIAILLEEAASVQMPRFRAEYPNVTVKIVRDLYSAITQELSDFSQSEIGHAFIASTNAYAETDLLDLFSF